MDIDKWLKFDPFYTPINDLWVYLADKCTYTLYCRQFSSLSLIGDSDFGLIWMFLKFILMPKNRLLWRVRGMWGAIPGGAPGLIPGSVLRHDPWQYLGDHVLCHRFETWLAGCQASALPLYHLHSLSLIVLYLGVCWPFVHQCIFQTGMALPRH